MDRPSHPPVTHKFGGSSVADAARIGRVVDVLLARDDAAQLIVVSAMQGVTDALIRAGRRAAAGDDGWRQDLAALAQRHGDAAAAVLGARAAAFDGWLEGQLAELTRALETMRLLGGEGGDALHYVQGMGEVLSARLVSEALAARGAEAAFLDAREVLVVRHEELGVAVEWDQTQRRFDAWVAAHAAPRIVATGFIARDGSGRVTTLGRNGSDYSATIFGALARSPEVHIWTDVDGVLSADPRVVPEAVLLPALSFHEACELAYFGAKVIHPQTMAPAIARGIPLRIRNTFAPDHPGTVIAAAAVAEPPVKGFTTFSDLALINVEGAGMIGVPGTAERVFGSLHRAGISVVMISQGSSEHSICCVVEAAKAERAVRVLRDAFAAELSRAQIQDVTATPDVSMLAVVGDGMAGTPGIAARLFAALARSRINVRAIAQGASERNISVVVARADAARALRAVHAGFLLSAQTVSIGVVGPGQVGSALLGQMATMQARLRRDANLDLRLRAVASSRRMALDDRGLDVARWAQALDGGEAVDLERLAEHVLAPHLPHAVIVDCSASSAVADHYAAWLARGVHVITPNKHAGSGGWERYQAIRAAAGEHGGRFRYEATVGAGLPVISTLRDMIDTGDEMLAVEGLLSGTLAWLLYRFDGSVPFSALVEEARANGYTEPDPRDDLSGVDVARKLVILAREMGQPLSLHDVAVESLVPERLRDVPRAGFLADLSALDAPMAERLAAARGQGMVLRHVARLTRDGEARVGLATVAPDHALAHGRLTDNIVQFTTGRYRDRPLVVQGPGAGPDVTAAGVFADLLRVAQGLGARL